jgi:hypothetical protein
VRTGCFAFDFAGFAVGEIVAVGCFVAAHPVQLSK